MGRGSDAHSQRQPPPQNGGDRGDRGDRGDGGGHGGGQVVISRNFRDFQAFSDGLTVLLMSHPATFRTATSRTMAVMNVVVADPQAPAPEPEEVVAAETVTMAINGGIGTLSIKKRTTKTIKRKRKRTKRGSTATEWVRSLCFRHRAQSRVIVAGHHRAAMSLRKWRGK